jgi:hypothetical protein
MTKGDAFEMAHHELDDELREEWFAERAQQIHRELQADFDRYADELHMDHMRSMLKAPGVPAGTADPRVTATASVISTADAILAAVAMFLARQEANTPEAS